MIKYVNGNLLQDSAEALVNTVNCEGFMGKGLAYQFKLSYPDTNKSYIRACKLGQLTVGTMHSFRENGKLVVNFPTKNKWRSNSRIVDVETGLDALVELIQREKVKSIAIPPLGCGNGGLQWYEVKKLIEQKLTPISDTVDIRIYSPSLNVINHEVIAPELGLDAYVLMLIKEQLKQFTMERLYVTLYLVNCLSEQKLLCTKAGKTSVRALNAECKKINAFQEHFGCKNVGEAKNILYNKIVSKSFMTLLKKLDPVISKSCNFVDKVEDRNLEGIINLFDGLTAQDIVNITVMDDLLEKAKLDSKLLNKLCELQIVEMNLLGYSLAKA